MTPVMSSIFTDVWIMYWAQVFYVALSLFQRGQQYAPFQAMMTFFLVFSRELSEYLHLVSMPTNWLSWWDSLSTKTPQWFSLTACTFCKMWISGAVQEVENLLVLQGLWKAKCSMGQTFVQPKGSFKVWA